MLESMAAGINAGLKENQGSNTLQTLASYKTRQDALREQARQFNEQYALEAQKVASDTRYRDAQTDTIKAQLDAYNTELKTLKQKAFRSEISNQVLGAVETGEWRGVMQALKTSEFGADIAKQLGGIQSVNRVSNEALLQIVTPDELKLIRNNPKSFVVLGNPDNYRIVNVEALGAAMGISNQLNAQQIQVFRDNITLKTMQELNEDNPNIPQIAAKIALTSSDKDQAQRAASMWGVERKASNQPVGIPEPKTKFGADYNNFNIEFSNAKNEQARQAILARYKTGLVDSYKQLSKEVGHDLTLSEFYQKLGDEGQLLMNSIKDADKNFQDLKKQANTQSGILAQQLMSALEANVETLKEIQVTDIKKKDAAMTWLSKNAPFAQKLWLSMQNLLGDNALMSYDSMQKYSANQAANLNFMVTFTKYISGVAFRPDEQDNVKKIYSEFGDSIAQKTSLIIQNLQQRKNELQKKRNQDPLNFALYQSDDLRTIEALLGMMNVMNAAASKKSAPTAEQKKKIENYRNVLLRIRGNGESSVAHTNQQPNGQTNRPASVPNNQSTLGGLFLKKSNTQGSTPTKSSSSLTPEQQQALNSAI